MSSPGYIKSNKTRIEYINTEIEIDHAAIKKMQLKEEIIAAKKMAKECPFISITIGGFPIELFNLD